VPYVSNELTLEAIDIVGQTYLIGYREDFLVIDPHKARLRA